MRKKTIMWIEELEYGVYSEAYRESLIKEFPKITLNYFSDWQAGERALKDSPRDLAIVDPLLIPREPSVHYPSEKVLTLPEMTECSFGLIDRVRQQFPTQPWLIFGELREFPVYERMVRERFPDGKVTPVHLPTTFPYEFNEIVRPYLR